MNIKGYIIIKSIKKMIFERIKEHQRGWAFSAHDFIHEFNRGEIDDSLSTLTEDGEIRRVIRGIYDYPIFNDLLSTKEAPNIDLVANAIARKFGWKIYPSGSTVLNNLSLSKYAAIHEHTASTIQVPEKNIFLIDGPNKKYNIGNQCIEFKHISQKIFTLKYLHTAEVIQAIKAVGKNQITNEFLNKLSEKYTFTEWEQIKTDASNSSGWVYEIIKEICNEIIYYNIYR